jgi:hypothetical protein
MSKTSTLSCTTLSLFSQTRTHSTRRGPRWSKRPDPPKAASRARKRPLAPCPFLPSVSLAARGSRSWHPIPCTASQTRRRSKRPHLGLNPHVRRRLASPSIFQPCPPLRLFIPHLIFFALSVVCRPQLEASGVQTGSRYAGGGARQVGGAVLDFFLFEWSVTFAWSVACCVV